MRVAVVISAHSTAGSYQHFISMLSAAFNKNSEKDEFCSKITVTGWGLSASVEQTVWRQWKCWSTSDSVTWAPERSAVMLHPHTVSLSTSADTQCASSNYLQNNQQHVHAQLWSRDQLHKLYSRQSPVFWNITGGLHAHKTTQSLTTEATKVCRYNWHSAGFTGRPFPMLKY